jgi:S-adenosylmethionine synthetase
MHSFGLDMCFSLQVNYEQVVRDTLKKIGYDAKVSSHSAHNLPAMTAWPL